MHCQKPSISLWSWNHSTGSKFHNGYTSKFYAWPTTPYCSPSPYNCIIPFEYQYISNGWHWVALCWIWQRVLVAEWNIRPTAHLSRLMVWTSPQTQLFIYSGSCQWNTVLCQSHHISHMIRFFYYHLQGIKTIRHYIPTPLAIQLMSALILAQIDYCSNILLVLLVIQPNCLQSVLNVSDRLIFGCHWNDHVINASSQRQASLAEFLSASSSNDACSHTEPWTIHTALVASPGLFQEPSQMIAVPNFTQTFKHSYSFHLQQRELSSVSDWPPYTVAYNINICNFCRPLWWTGEIINGI